MVNKMNVIKIKSKNEKKKASELPKNIVAYKKKHCRSGLF